MDIFVKLEHEVTSLDIPHLLIFLFCKIVYLINADSVVSLGDAEDV